MLVLAPVLAKGLVPVAAQGRAQELVASVLMARVPMQVPRSWTLHLSSDLRQGRWVLVPRFLSS